MTQILKTDDTLLSQYDLHVKDNGVYTIPGAALLSKLVPYTDIQGRYLYLQLKAVDITSGQPIPTTNTFKLNFNRVEVLVSQLKSSLIGATGAKGEKGDKGDQGEQGDHGLEGVGSEGPRGEQGIQGPPGSTGATGSSGPRGEKGLPGDKGDTGDTGAQGETGGTGAQGPKGDKGDRGEHGTQGIPGRPGPIGPRGVSGSRGPTGVPGPKGDKGDQGAPGSAHFNAYTESSILNGEPDFEHESLPSFRTSTLDESELGNTFLGTNKTRPVQILNIPRSYLSKDRAIQFTGTNLIPEYKFDHEVTNTSGQENNAADHPHDQSVNGDVAGFNYLTTENSDYRILSGTPLPDEVKGQNNLARAVGLFFKDDVLYGFGKEHNSNPAYHNVQKKYRFIQFWMGMTEGSGTGANAPVPGIQHNENLRFTHEATLTGQRNSNSNAGIQPVVLEYKGEHYLIRSNSPSTSSQLAISKITKQEIPLSADANRNKLFNLTVQVPVTGITLNTNDLQGFRSSGSTRGDFHHAVKSWVVGRNHVYVIGTIGHFKIPIEEFFSKVSTARTYNLIRTPLYHGEPIGDRLKSGATEDEKSKAGFILDELGEYIGIQGLHSGDTNYSVVYGKRFSLSHGAYTEIEFTNSADVLIAKTDIPVGAVTSVDVRYNDGELVVKENVGGEINEIKGDISPLINGQTAVGSFPDPLGIGDRSIQLQYAPRTYSTQLASPVMYFHPENNTVIIDDGSFGRGSHKFTQNVDKLVGSTIKASYASSNTFLGVTAGEYFTSFSINSIKSKGRVSSYNGNIIIYRTVLDVSFIKTHFGDDPVKKLFKTTLPTTGQVYLRLTPMKQELVDTGNYLRSDLPIDPDLLVSPVRHIELRPNFYNGTTRVNGPSAYKNSEEFFTSISGSDVFEDLTLPCISMKPALSEPHMFTVSTNAAAYAEKGYLYVYIPYTPDEVDSGDDMTLEFDMYIRRNAATASGVTPVVEATSAERRFEIDTFTNPIGKHFGGVLETASGSAQNYYFKRSPQYIVPNILADGRRKVRVTIPLDVSRIMTVSDANRAHVEGFLTRIIMPRAIARTAGQEDSTGLSTYDDIYFPIYNNFRLTKKVK